MKGTQNQIRFLLGHRQVRIDFEKDQLPPTLTVLNWLRQHRGLTGVKEGCAEGDCGACTVVLAEPAGNDRLRYYPVNSCLLFLPALHGKQLITIHHLAGDPEKQDTLHPVQQAMIDHHGIQCGFCTPGITMSLFALAKSSTPPTRELTELALSGNLCRCTGYLPVLEAAKTQNICTDDHFSKHESETAHTLNTILNQSTDLRIKVGNRRYFRPLTLGTALDYLDKNPDALIINGATDIALRQTKNFAVLDHLIDLSGIGELKQLRRTEKGWIAGAGVTIESLTGIAGNEIPALAELGKRFGSKQIREMATIGGNLGTASPIGDLLPLLMAAGASVELTAVHSKRNLSIGEWITGYRQTARKPRELLTSVLIPVRPEIRFYKVSKRRDVDIASVSGGFRLELKDGLIKDVCLAFGGMAAIPKRAGHTEDLIKGKPWNAETVKEAVEGLTHDFNPISDARNSSEYRMAAAAGLIWKFYYDTHE